MKNSIFLMLTFILFSSCSRNHEHYELAKKYYKNGSFYDAMQEVKLIKQPQRIMADLKNILERQIEDTLKSIVLVDKREMKKHRSDTLFMDFRFNMTKLEAVKHANKLIREKKLRPKMVIPYKNDFGAYKMDYSYFGYPCDFYLPDYKCTALLKLYFFRNKLSSMRIYIMDSPNRNANFDILLGLNTLYQKKYGESEDPKYWLFPSDHINEIDHFWREKNKAIYNGVDSNNLVYITYEDLVAKYDKKNEEDAAKEAESQKNLANQKI